MGRESSSTPTGPGVPNAYRDLLSEAEFSQLQEAIQRPLLPAIRLNTLKIDLGQARNTWPDWYGWQIRPIPFCHAGWQVVGGGENLSQTLEYKLGDYYIQEAASMLPVELFHFDAGTPQTVLDLAAAPGGKTTHLVSRMDDQGVVIANDSSAGRIPALQANLQAWGASCAIVTTYPGENFGSWFPEQFDKVLLDAPCSVESLRGARHRRKQPVSTKEREGLYQRQVRLLTSAFQAVKPGGQVVYSTCTLSPEENEAVLDTLFRLYPQQTAIGTVDHVLGQPAPALETDGLRWFHPQIRQAVRLWPHLYDTSGFFTALINKRDSITISPHAPPSRSLADSGWRPLRPQEESPLLDDLQQTYGFDLGAVLERQALSLWSRGPAVYALSDRFLTQFPDFPCISAGLLIGDQSEEPFVPSHELVTRFGSQFTHGRLTLSAEQASLWLAGQDLRRLETPYPLRQVILLEDEKHRLLGRGRVLADRVRNLLPRRMASY